MHTSLDLPYSCKFMSSQTSTTVSQHLTHSSTNKISILYECSPRQRTSKKPREEENHRVDVSMLPLLHCRQDNALMLDVRENELIMGISLFPHCKTTHLPLPTVIKQSPYKPVDITTCWKNFIPETQLDRLIPIETHCNT